MKNFFKKFKSYGFWVSLSAAVIVLLNALGRAFGFSIDEKIVDDVVMSLASLLVVLGIVDMSTNKDKGDDDFDDDDNLPNDGANMNK